MDIVTCKKTIKFLKNKILSYWDDDRQDKIFFPAPQPVSLERKDFKKLCSEPYVVCAKLDGERFLMLSTKVPSTFFSKKCNLLNKTFMVNRKFDFFEIHQIFSEDTFNDTLLDGEYIDDTFVVHDTFILKGENLKNKNWEYRWRSCDKFLNENYNHSCIRICLKKFYHIYEIDKLFYEIKKDNIKSDGIVFYPMNEPVKYKTQNDLFKWKPYDKHTIDFKIKLDKQYIYLYVYNRSKEQLFATIPRDRCTWCLKDDMILECTIKGNTFYPFKIRNDKKNSNNYYTAKKTMLNYKENIKSEDLIMSFKRQR